MPPPLTGAIDQFNVDDLVEASSQLRTIGRDKPFMVEAAADVATYLYDSLRGCQAVVVHKTHVIADLPADLAEAVEAPTLRSPRQCLARLAVRGSVRGDGIFGAAVVPLEAEVLRPSALVGRALQALEVPVDEVLDPLVGQRQLIQRRSLGVFHLDVSTADLSFDERAPLSTDGICSVIAFGGGLLTGQMFIVWLLCSLPVPTSAAMLFRSLAPAVQSALVPTTFRSFG